MGSKNPIEVIAENVTRSGGDIFDTAGGAGEELGETLLTHTDDLADTLTAHIEENIIDPLVGEQTAGVAESISGTSSDLTEDLISGSTEEVKEKKRLEREAAEAAAKSKRGRKGTDEAFGFDRGRARARGSSTLLGGGGRGPLGRGPSLLGG